MSHYVARSTDAYELGMAVNVLFMRFFFEDISMEVPWYLLAVTGVALMACWRTGWKRLWLWVYVYGVLTVQSLFTVLGVEIDDGWLLYATAPLLFCSAFENIIIATVSNQGVRTYLAWLDGGEGTSHKMPLDMRPPWLTRLFANIYRDEDVRTLYASYLDTYLTVCACVLTFHDAGLFRAKCGAVAYAPVAMAFYMATDRHRDTRHLEGFALPAAAVKAVYVLYAPTRFWFNLFIVAMFNSFVIEAPSTRRLFVGASFAMILFTVYVQPNLDSCPV